MLLQSCRWPGRLLAGLLLFAWGIPAEASQTKGLSGLREHIVSSLLTAGSQVDAEAAQRYAADIRSDGSWADIDYADQARSTWKTYPHLTRTLVLARAWRNPALKSHADPAILEAAGRALDWWLNHDYQNPNWWHNQISVPRAIGEILVLLGDQAGTDRLNKAATILARSDWVTRVDVRLVPWTGANLTDMAWNRILRGVLQGNEPVVKDAFNRAFEEVRVVPPGEEGIQADFSFHQHGSVVYDGGYGEAFVQAVSRFVVISDGTIYAPPPKQRALITSYLLDGAQWMIRSGLWDYGVIGRSITRSGRTAAGMTASLEALAQLPDPRMKELAAFASRLNGASTSSLIGNRQFWCSDLMVHQRPRWYASARGYSTRTVSTDGPHNGEGIRSHFISDGANFLIRDGKEYADIFPVWDWRKVPGTTVAQSSTPLDPLHPQRVGTTSFVGGVSDGLYGMATMDLDHAGLSAVKSWFFFDEEYVCLGAEITDSSEDTVATTVDQRFLRGSVQMDANDGPVSGVGATIPARWVLHDSVGYLFPAGTHVHLDTGKRSGKWSDIGTGSSALLEKDVFTLWIDHGTHPSGGSYCYEVVPNSSKRDLQQRAEKDPVTVLSNTRALQAVWNERLRIVQAAYRQSGSMDLGDGWRVSVDKPCLLMARRKGSSMHLAVANPKNRGINVKVTISSIAKPERKRTISVGLPDGPMAGSSVLKDVPLPD